MKVSALAVSPEALGVPHASWREGQFEAILAFEGSLKKYFVGQMPTGFGKSAVATGINRNGRKRLTLHVHTLSLLDQYADMYGWDVVKGMGNYECVHEKKVERWIDKFGRVPKASDCHFSPMTKCPYYAGCPYVQARERAYHSSKCAVTYRFGVLSDQIRQRTGTLILDEVHGAGDELRDMWSIEVSQDELDKWGLPEIPFIFNYGPNGGGDTIDHRSRVIILDWANRVRTVFTNEVIDKFDRDTDPAIVESAMGLLQKVDTIRAIAMGRKEDTWFLKAGPHAGFRRRRGKSEEIPAISVKPLTAARASEELFQHKNKVLMMSATIGKPKPLMNELGVSMSEVDFFEAPHPVPPEYRPVYDLQFSKMTWANLKKNPGLYRQQAQEIMRALDYLDPSYRGMMLTSSMAKIKRLMLEVGRNPRYKKRLARSNVYGTMTDMPYWLDSTVPGEIAIATMQGYSTGLDLYGDKGRFVVVAGVPFKTPDDNYHQIRKKIPGTADYEWWVSYISVVQASGRVSRGEQLPSGKWMTNYTFIADGSAMTGPAKSHYPQWWKDAIVRI